MKGPVIDGEGWAKGPIAFLDRDGVLNYGREGYVNNPSQMNVIPGAGHAIAQLRESGFTICVVTNQSGVARGYFTEEQFWKTHNYITKCCIDLGLDIDFTCVNFFEKNNYFRKPNIGMLETVINYCKADRIQSFMVGDKETDKISADKSFINYRDVNFFI